jgi:hypothetical protein
MHSGGQSARRMVSGTCAPIQTIRLCQVAREPGADVRASPVPPRPISSACRPLPRNTCPTRPPCRDFRSPRSCSCPFARSRRTRSKASPRLGMNHIRRRRMSFPSDRSSHTHHNCWGRSACSRTRRCIRRHRSDRCRSRPGRSPPPRKSSRTRRSCLGRSAHRRSCGHTRSRHLDSTHRSPRPPRWGMDHRFRYGKALRPDNSFHTRRSGPGRSARRHKRRRMRSRRSDRCTSLPGTPRRLCRSSRTCRSSSSRSVRSRRGPRTPSRRSDTARRLRFGPPALRGTATRVPPALSSCKRGRGPPEAGV